MRYRFILMMGVFGLSGCEPAKKTEQITTPMTVDASELTTLAQQSVNKTGAYAGLPATPVDAACFGAEDQFALCESDRLQMLKAWPLAWKGDYQAQRNVAFMLSSPTLGVPQNAIQGCAWRIVLLSSGHAETSDLDVKNHDMECGKLTEVQLTTAKSSASEIYKFIKGTPHSAE